MIYDSFTTYAISSFTNRNCIRFVELPYVIVAVFDQGRACFISKRKLHQFVVRQECRNDGRLQAEWKIGALAEVEKKTSAPSLDVVQKRVRRAGFTAVQIEGDRVVGCLPRDNFDRGVAIQIAKENNWTIQNGQVFVA